MSITPCDFSSEVFAVRVQKVVLSFVDVTELQVWFAIIFLTGIHLWTRSKAGVSDPHFSGLSGLVPASECLVGE